MESTGHCLICGREIGGGIDMHVKYKHGMEYDHYCKYFSQATGSYSVYEKGSKTVITMTREVKPLY